MHIDRIHVQQDTTRTVVAMCADDTTIFAGGLDDIALAKEVIQCYMDAVEEINDHVVFTITTCVHPEQRHQEQHCAGQQPD